MTQSPPAMLELVIVPSQSGERLDSVLTRAWSERAGGLSRSRLRVLIEDGHVRLLAAAATVLEPSRRVKPGERYRLVLPPARPAAPAAQEIPLDVVYEDMDLIVIDKPAGLVVHPAAGNPDRTLVNALIAHCGPSLSGIGGVARPGIVHRLDKETSGLMLAAKTDLAHQGLAAQFAAHGRDGKLSRAYQAFVWGVPAPAAGVIDAPLGRNPRNRKAFAVIQSGKPAVTHYKTLARLGPASLIECRLETGRTHQIRVHMAHIGHPLLGDPVYGARRNAGAGPAQTAARHLGRQALHAAELGFVHPRTGKRLCFSSPPPKDLRLLRETLEGL